MAQQIPAAAEQRQQPKTDNPEKPELVIVELGKRRSPKQVRRLRKGRGKLMRDIDEVIADLTTAGTIKANAQPVVIVVREMVPLPWPMNTAGLDEEDDDDD